jgi:hypothetical protein
VDQLEELVAEFVHGITFRESKPASTARRGGAVGAVSARDSYPWAGDRIPAIPVP